jgi:signal transduction histidine kinase
VSPDKIDWSQLWYPGPTRVFTPTELERAGRDRPSRTLVTMVMINMAILAMAVLQSAPPRATALLTGLLAAAAVVSMKSGLALWRLPTRRRLTYYSLGIGLGTGIAAGLIRGRVADDTTRVWAVATCVGAALLLTIGLWFLALYRAHQIAARLREQDERERREDMARQLAQAQIQPHFLFNSLASLQQWVQTKDDRAPALLDALMGFLRTTLPLFDRPQLGVGEEAEAVRHYLGVMQLRLGERLRWTVEIDPGATAAVLPPGLLLTLVENAIEHGVQQSLAGAEVWLRAERIGERLRVDVLDRGPGIAADAADGVGLANARTRLTQAFGRTATLVLERAAGGTLARIDCPFTTLAA